MGAPVDKLIETGGDLSNIEVAAALEVHPLWKDNPSNFERAEAQLIDMIEQRRRFESWRLGIELTFKVKGFVRTADRIELRGKLLPSSQEDGLLLRDRDGVGRFWPGPHHPKGDGIPTIESLPFYDR